MLALVLAVTVAADPAARSDAPAGAITAQPPGGPVRVLPAKPDLPAGELLTVLPGVAVRSANGAVSVTCRADPFGQSPVPVLETAFTLDPPAAGTDLSLTLDRGRIDLASLKADGPATVAVKLRQFGWTVTLNPGSRVAVELAGRRPPGTRFKPDAEPVEPVLSAVLVGLAGTAGVTDGRTTVTLTAPPGPSLLNWTSTRGADPKVVRLDRLPDWASPAADNTPDGRAVRAAVEKFRAARASNADTAADVLLSSRAPAEWRVGLVATAAADDLARLAKVMTESPDVAVWDAGVAVLRHWLGRGPGQDRKLFRFLTDTRGYDPVAAATVIDLLAGFTPAELARAETYDVLVEYLQHDKPGVRNLAHWHLTRLVPAGRAIPFRPNAGKAELRPAYTQWRRLVPPGAVPASATGKEPAARP